MSDVHWLIPSTIAGGSGLRSSWSGKGDRSRTRAVTVISRWVGEYFGGGKRKSGREIVVGRVGSRLEGTGMGVGAG